MVLRLIWISICFPKRDLNVHLLVPLVISLLDALWFRLLSAANPLQKLTLSWHKSVSYSKLQLLWLLRTDDLAHVVTK